MGSGPSTNGIRLEDVGTEPCVWRLEPAVATVLEQLSETVLREGQSLYPYSAEALKNTHRYSFGQLFPEACAEMLGERSALGVEVLLRCSARADVSLQVQARFMDHQEPAHLHFLSPSRPTLHTGELALELKTEVRRLSTDLFRIQLRVENSCNATASGGPKDATEARAAALGRSVAGVHILLVADGAAFVSLVDPPSNDVVHADHCEQVGLWPALVGAPGQAQAVIAAPIILPDYAKLAPETTEDFCDATEIDEMLRLRVLTLTDAEQAELARRDMTAKLLHAAHRGSAGPRPLTGRLERAPRGLVRGARVRLSPSRARDAFDMALAGRTAQVVDLEHDYEGRLHVAVVAEGDPGADMGPFQHRFFFSAQEVELLP